LHTRFSHQKVGLDPRIVRSIGHTCKKEKAQMKLCRKLITQNQRFKRFSNKNFILFSYEYWKEENPRHVDVKRIR